MNTKKSTLLSIALLSMHLLAITQAAQDPESLDVDDHKDAESETTVVSNQKEKQPFYNQVLSYLVFGEKDSTTKLDEKTYLSYYGKSLENLKIAHTFLLEKSNSIKVNFNNINDLTEELVNCKLLNTRFNYIFDYMESIHQRAYPLLGNNTPLSEPGKAIFVSILDQIALEPEKLKLNKEKCKQIMNEINQLKEIGSACFKIAEAIDYKDCERPEERIKNFTKDYSEVLGRIDVKNEQPRVGNILHEFSNAINVNSYRYYKEYFENNQVKLEIGFFNPPIIRIKTGNNCISEKQVRLGTIKYSLEQKGNQINRFCMIALTLVNKYLLSE